MRSCGVLLSQWKTVGVVTCSKTFRKVQCFRFVRTTAYRDDPNFIDPQDPLKAGSDTIYEHSNDGFFVEPVVGRSNPGIGVVLLNLDRKPGDGARGVLTNAELKTVWQGRVLRAQLRSKVRPRTDGSCNPQRGNPNRSTLITLNAPQGASAGAEGELPSSSNPVHTAMINYYKSCPLSQRAVCILFRKLRNHEVNTLQRVIALASVREAAFAGGISKLEWLMMAEASQCVGELQPYVLETLANLAELSWLVHTYQKPLISYSNGSMEDEGAALCFLANHSAVYKEASVTFSFSAYGLAPIGGLSHVLSRLPSNVGFYLALTGHRVSNSELLECGLANYWMSPEAIPFLELTSASQLEVSEHDAKGLLREHFLDPGCDGPGLLAQWEKPISWVFSSTSLKGIIHRLRLLVERNGPEFSSSVQPRVSLWATDTLALIMRRPLIAQLATFELLHRVRCFRRSLLQKCNISYNEWHRLRQTGNQHAQTVTEVSKKQLVEVIDEQTLELALGMELRVVSRLLLQPDTLESLRHAACSSWLLNQEDHRMWPATPRYQKFEDVPEDFLDMLFQPLSEKHAFAEFHNTQRSPLPLSKHPWLRKLHPDYNKRTQLDFDPLSMNTKRWDPEYFENARKLLVKMLTAKQQPFSLFDWE